MNIKDKHSDKVISAYPLFKGIEGSATAIQIQKGEQLKEHITKTEAFLICISGSARFGNEKGETHDLKSGDCVLIEPMVKHWVDGIETSQLMLLK
ncbi:MAG: cupin domain-containing protein [Flavobacteriales bacterium]|nr:cupin domain-containing protein [Flavobacteriales bacterium]